MRIDELRSLLSMVEPQEGALPEWCNDLSLEELASCVGWLRTRLDQIDRHIVIDALLRRVRTCKAQESPTSMLQPLFDNAIEKLIFVDDVDKLKNIIDDAEKAHPGVSKIRLWIDVFDLIESYEDKTKVKNKKTKDNSDNENKPNKIVRFSDAEAKVILTRRKINNIINNKNDRWGIDFGTARSKVVFRNNNFVQENANTTWDVPSIVVVNKNGDRILFGEEANLLQRDVTTWNVCTSMKRYIVGKKINIEGMPKEMTTERLVILYIAWMLHKMHKSAPSKSPCDSFAHLSLPLTRNGDEPELRDPFTHYAAGVYLKYDKWLPKAFRLAQLVAITYRDEDWPESVQELLWIVQAWGLVPWNEICLEAKTISEPSAVAGDCQPNISDGLTMLIDCGAGTTDVSVFWKKDNIVYKVTEHSGVVGGDLIDEEITNFVINKQTKLTPYKHGIKYWARNIKPTLIAQGKVELDPEIEFDLKQIGMPIRITRNDINNGIIQLCNSVKDIIQEAIDATENALLDAKPKGQLSWPTIQNIKNVWIFGGSSVVPGMDLAIKDVLLKKNIKPSISQLKNSNQYTSWNTERYRLFACAAGASRQHLNQPTDLPSSRPSEPLGLGPADED